MTNEKLTRILKMSVPIAAMLSALAGGCKSHEERPPEDMQPGDKLMAADEVSEVTRLMNVQVANGARTDGTLRPYHFSQGNLNSLGREKLDSMVDGGEDSKAELVVYLDLPTSDVEKALTDARHDAVTHHLMGRGLGEDSFRLESGYNPNNTMLAASLRAKETDAAGEESGESSMGGSDQSFAPAGSGSK
jgi:hypothetical protein